MSESFTKSDLIDQIAEENDLSKSSAKVIVDGIFDTFVKQLAVGNKVTIAGFGNFEVKTREARTGRNPATGATIEIKQARSIGFKPAKAAKDKL